MAVNTINRPKTTKPIQLGGDVELELLELPLSPCGVGMASDMAGILDSLVVVIKTVWSSDSSVGSGWGQTIRYLMFGITTLIYSFEV